MITVPVPDYPIETDEERMSITSEYQMQIVCLVRAGQAKLLFMREACANDWAYADACRVETGRCRILFGQCLTEIGHAAVQACGCTGQVRPSLAVSAEESWAGFPAWHRSGYQAHQVGNILAA